MPGFSLFSALSEVLVTVGVLWIVRRNWMRRPFALGAFLALVLFEALVNVLYMASRASQAAANRGSALSPAMRAFYAGHGVLSLLAYLVFVVLGVVAWQQQRRGRFLFRLHPAWTGTFVAVWLVSVLSGEGIFLARYVR